MPIRYLNSHDIITVVVDAIGKISFQPDEAIARFFTESLNKEESDLAKDVIKTYLDNIKISGEEQIPLCQDTGTMIVFAEMGREVFLQDTTLFTALNEAVRVATAKFYLRASILTDPLYRRINTGNNTPVVLHLAQMEGDKLILKIGQKGGGAENMSRIRMFPPSSTTAEIIEFVLETISLAGSKACPPLVVGVGIGGNFETCALLAKEALFDTLESCNPIPEYAELEREILAKINELRIGASGMGGISTAFAVKIRTAPCHIASLPVAVNLQCHAHRHCEIII